MKKMRSKLDEELMAELSKKKPSERKIRELVKQGADVNSVDENGFDILSIVTRWAGLGLDNKFLLLLIELGADINYVNFKYNSCALKEACLSNNIELTKQYLEMGAKVNVIFKKFDAGSLLDSVESNASIAKHFSKIKRTRTNKYLERNDESWKKRYNEWKETIKLLKKYGAKRSKDIVANKVKKSIKVKKEN